MKPAITIAGTGILGVGHLTLETVGHIKNSDVVYYLVSDPITEEFIMRHNPNTISLHHCYRDGTARIEAYESMIATVLDALARHQTICVLFYGHPGIFVYPSHEIVKRTRRLGYEARMLPGISSEDCLFADLGVDPGVSGCQSYEATDFLLRKRTSDPRSPLVLWQVGVIGDLTYRANGYGTKHLALLTERLLDQYPPDHEVVLYEASHFTVCRPRAERTRLSDLPQTDATAVTTLYVPPCECSAADDAVATRFGFVSSAFERQAS